MLMAAASLPAHHSFAAEYDSKKPLELKGKVLEIEWVNPHAWIHLEVPDADEEEDEDEDVSVATEAYTLEEDELDDYDPLPGFE